MDNRELVETLEDFGFNDAIKHTSKILEQIDLVDTIGIIKRYFPGNKLETDQTSFYFCRGVADGAWPQVDFSK